MIKRSASPELILAINSAIELYESMNGFAASRTRHMIENKGHIVALSDLVRNPRLQKGFMTLRDKDALSDSFEAVITRFATEFSSPIVQAAQWRISNANNLVK